MIAAPAGIAMMLTVVSATCLLFAACALLYQADDRRSAFARVRGSRQIRWGLRGLALVIFLVTLAMVSTLQGLELGVPVWLGLFSFAFVAGLFLSAQKPDWHPRSAAIVGTLGMLTGLGALVL